MPRIECYVSYELKQKISKSAEKKFLSASKYISQILENHFELGESQFVFQRKVMAILCDIYSCVFDPDVENVNRDAVVAHMREIKRQCEEAALMVE